MSVAWLPFAISLVVLGVIYGQAGWQPLHTAQVRYDVQARVGPQVDWAASFRLHLGEDVLILERTRVTEASDPRPVETWIHVSRGALQGWIPARAVYLSEGSLRDVPQARIPPVTVMASVAVTARAGPDVNARTTFDVPASTELNVIGRSDDSDWIAVARPENEWPEDGPRNLIGWIKSSQLTPDRGRLEDLPAYLPDGLAVATVVGPPATVRLAEHAFWDSWAWDSKGSTIWFHRITEHHDGELWKAPRRLSSAWLAAGEELWVRTTDYDVRGVILPSPRGGSLLVRGSGSFDDQFGPVVILEPDGRMYPLAPQRAFYATDAKLPFAGDAQWSPDGRHVILKHGNYSGGGLVLYDRNGEVAHLGIGSQLLFHPNSASVFYRSGGAIQRVDLGGRPYPEFQSIPANHWDGFGLTADGNYIVTVNDLHGLVATLSTSDGRFVRSWPVDVAPKLSPDGKRVMYSVSGTLWLQDLEDGALRRVGELTEQRPSFGWSTDSARVVFESPEGLRIANASGRSTAARLIIHGQRFRRWQWSPDGHWLAVEALDVHWPPAAQHGTSSLTDDGLASYFVTSQIRVFAGDGRLHRSWRVASGCRDLAWSPDSKWLAYGGPAGCA